MPGSPTNLDNYRAWAYCSCSGCQWVCLESFSRQGQGVLLIRIIGAERAYFACSVYICAWGEGVDYFSLAYDLFSFYLSPGDRLI